MGAIGGAEVRRPAQQGLQAAGLCPHVYCSRIGRSAGRALRFSRADGHHPRRVRQEGNSHRPTWAGHGHAVAQGDPRRGADHPHPVPQRQVRLRAGKPEGDPDRLLRAGSRHRRADPRAIRPDGLGRRCTQRLRQGRRLDALRHRRRRRLQRRPATDHRRARRAAQEDQRHLHGAGLAVRHRRGAGQARDRGLAGLAAGQGGPVLQALRRFAGKARPGRRAGGPARGRHARCRARRARTRQGRTREDRYQAGQSGLDAATAGRGQDCGAARGQAAARCRSASTSTRTRACAHACASTRTRTRTRIGAHQCTTAKPGRPCRPGC